jgi:RecJ-like exonuclease
MSYTYDEPQEGIDYEVCRACDGTGGTCVTGHCYECDGNGTIWHCVPWEYRDYMHQQQARDKAKQGEAAV